MQVIEKTALFTAIVTSLGCSDVSSSLKSGNESDKTVITIQDSRQWLEGLGIDLEKVKEESKLNLCWKNVTDEQMEYLAPLSTLGIEKLSICNDGFEDSLTGRGLKYIANFTSLTWLDLDSNRIEDQYLHHLSGLNRLQTLKIFKNSIKGSGLEALSGLPLKSLLLGYNPIEKTGLEQLGRFSHLTRLSIRHGNFEASDLAYLQGSKTIESLSLDNNGLRFEDLQHFFSIKNLPLTNIGLGSNPIENTSVVPLIGEIWPRIDYIGLVETRLLLTQVDGACLPQGSYDLFQNLKNISLYGNPVSANCIEKMTDGFRKNNPEFSLDAEDIVLIQEDLLDQYGLDFLLDEIAFGKNIDLAGGDFEQVRRESRFYSDVLKYFFSMEHVSFENSTNLTDKMIRTLARGTGLKSVNLKGHDVSEETQVFLRREMPSCQFEF